MTGRWGKSALVVLLFYVVVAALGFIEAIPVVGWIVQLLIAGPLTFGLYVYFLLTARSENPSAASLFSGFERFKDTFLLYLLSTIFIWLWTLLLIVPGIIAAFRYSQAYFILKDNPDIGALEAIRRSKTMMIGHKGRLFVLFLTFIGWYILGALSLGIGFLWIAPYFLTAFGHFHDDLKSRSSGVPAA